MKKLIVCADDYAMAPQIDDAIIELLMNERISATSCVTLSSNWKQSAQNLSEFKGKAALGLHFDLGGMMSLPQLMVRSTLRTLDSNAILKSLKTQLDKFEDEMGCIPQYLDGHQHIHAFPQIRNIVLKEISERYQGKNVWIRNPCTSLRGHDASIKAAAVKLLNWQHESLIDKFGLQHNHQFAGLYSLDENVGFPSMMENWLLTLESNSLIMCHPAVLGAKVEHSKARQLEYEYLASEEYLECLNINKIHLTHTLYPSDPAE